MSLKSAPVDASYYSTTWYQTLTTAYADPDRGITSLQKTVNPTIPEYVIDIEREIKLLLLCDADPVTGVPQVTKKTAHNIDAYCTQILAKQKSVKSLRTESKQLRDGLITFLKNTSEEQMSFLFGPDGLAQYREKITQRDDVEKRCEELKKIDGDMDRQCGLLIYAANQFFKELITKEKIPLTRAESMNPYGVSYRELYFQKTQKQDPEPLIPPPAEAPPPLKVPLEAPAVPVSALPEPKPLPVVVSQALEAAAQVEASLAPAAPVQPEAPALAVPAPAEPEAPQVQGYQAPRPPPQTMKDTHSSEPVEDGVMVELNDLPSSSPYTALTQQPRTRRTTRGGGGLGTSIRAKRRMVSALPLDPSKVASV